VAPVVDGVYYRGY